MTRASIIGFKDPKADLHRKSPKILAVSVCVSLAAVYTMLVTPFETEKTIEAKVKKPPVIIQIENVPQTRHVVRTPAPRLGIPLEVSDDLMPDDVTIETTDLDVQEVIAPAPQIEMVEEEPQAETVEEEIFEFFAVEEQPERLSAVEPEYPGEARRAGIEGTVFVRALVGKEGRVTEVEVLKGPEMLQDAAVQAAFATAFTPARQNDMAVACWVQMRFNFELE